MIEIEREALAMFGVVHHGLTHINRNLWVLHTGYLNDHRIQGRILLPGAAMFEMSCAAAHCMHSSALHGLLLGVSISAPCILQDTSTTSHKVLSCSVEYGTGRLEVRSAIAASSSAAAARRRGQLHLTGWAGLIAAESSGLNHGHERRELRLLNDLLRPAVGARAELPTAVAGLVPGLAGTCGQPGGYAVHPAVLDSATHTAAAFSGNHPNENGERHSGIVLPILCAKVTLSYVRGSSPARFDYCQLSKVLCGCSGDEDPGGVGGVQCSCGCTPVVHWHAA